MKSFFYYSYVFLLVVVLTILTQIGGLILILSFVISGLWKKNFKGKNLIVFFALYFLSTIGIVPYVAPLFGREKVRHAERIKPTMYLTDLLNRNYVVPSVNTVLENASKELEGTGIEIRYLDANFPFINKFPLLPHLSHNDGKKIDLSLIYKTRDGKITNKKKSISGYGVFAGREANEYNQVNTCKNSGYFQYDYPKYLTLGSKNKGLEYSNDGSKKLLESVLRNKDIQKVFIEPHLNTRLQIKDDRIRFQGCRSVRHDDHIHLQVY